MLLRQLEAVQGPSWIEDEWVTKQKRKLLGKPSMPICLYNKDFGISILLKLPRLRDRTPYLKTPRSSVKISRKKILTANAYEVKFLFNLR
jgi:hypothetical protein